MAIFISYSREDADVASVIASRLEERGESVFIDYSNLIAGDEFLEVIGAKIESSDAVLILLSAHSVESKWVRWEVSWALRLRKRIIPVMLDLVSWTSIFPLANIHWIDFRDFGTDEARLKALRQLDNVFKHLPRQSLGSHLTKGSDDVASGQTQTTAELELEMPEEVLLSTTLDVIRLSDDDPESAVYLAGVVLQQSPNYLGGWLREQVTKIELELDGSRVVALESRLQGAINRGDRQMSQLVGNDILMLRPDHPQAKEVLEELMRQKQCEELYSAAGQATPLAHDEALYLLTEVRRLCPDFGDPEGLLSNEPITSKSVRLVRQLAQIGPDPLKRTFHGTYSFSPERNLVAFSGFSKRMVALHRTVDGS